MPHRQLPPSIIDWLGSQQTNGKSKYTISAYTSALRHFCCWYEAAYSAAFTPDKTMPRDIRDWKAYQQTVEKAAPATINQRLVAVNRFFQWALKQKLIHENPADEISGIQLGS